VSSPGSAAQTVRDIIEANHYLVLATADAAGRPWSSPVYFAHIELTDFFWVSSPEATHSRNIAVRPEAGIAIFDSQVPIGAGQGVYMSAVARLLDEDETARGLEAFSRRSVAHGGHEWSSENVRPDAGLRLFQATADAHWILAKDGQPDHRVPVPLRTGRRTGRGRREQGRGKNAMVQQILAAAGLTEDERASIDANRVPSHDEVPR
jgi:nitroimidazol reductase NimA-like FMN-containing flavoprotein (pyridoxamine 5'-phosphate oxidase superfamily)